MSGQYLTAVELERQLSNVARDMEMEMFSSEQWLAQYRSEPDSGSGSERRASEPQDANSLGRLSLPQLTGIPFVAEETIVY